METITLGQIVDAVGGVLLGGFDDLSAAVSAVDTDSRNMRPGSLFVPLEGERFDGHAFIPAALEAGAVGCLTARQPERLRPDKFYVKVESARKALGDLARWYKSRFDIPFVCVTGSVGKTTTKDMAAAVLGEKYRVLKTAGNFNNDIGLPLTLFRLERDTEICVLEMGMNHAGEIEYLSGIAQPDAALITNVGDAHIENLGSREGIFRAKCEIFSHMKPGGLAILNGDDERLSALRGSLPFETVLVGTGAGLDYTASQPGGDGETYFSCRVDTPRQSFSARTSTLGRHMVYPILMAAALGERFGLTAEEIARGVERFRPTGMRMKVRRCGDGALLLEDAYNANPQSMQAAAAVLGEMKDRRRVAVVGDMLELGEESPRFHREVGACFAREGAQQLIAIGPLARHIAEGAREAGLADVSHFDELDEALPAVRGACRPGTAVLIKASHAMGFEKIAEALTAGREEGTG